MDIMVSLISGQNAPNFPSIRLEKQVPDRINETPWLGFKITIIIAFALCQSEGWIAGKSMTSSTSLRRTPSQQKRCHLRDQKIPISMVKRA